MVDGGKTDAGANCTVGSSGCACATGSTCNPGLACIASICRVTVCGDGRVDQGEECDDGNTIDTDACRKNCKLAKCGDGVVQAGVEECDDGNSSNTDSCTNSCKNAKCGDGFVQGTEECDTGATGNTGACLANCHIARCGDGFVQDGVETCDDGNQIDNDACTNSCHSPTCGDGVVQSPEECDDGNTVNTDSCSNTCKSARCGDGVVQIGEACDDGNTSNYDSCTNACKLPRCGDGFLQGSEECDDGNSIDSDSCSNACKKHYNVAFVTSTTYGVASMGGVAGADAACQARAAAGGLTGTFVAWISSSTSSVVDRLGTARGWLRTDGKPFLDESNGPATFYPPDLTESGMVVTDSAVANGGAEGCNDWTSSSSAIYGIGTGDPTGGTGAWSGSFGAVTCDATFRLYCLQKDYSNPLTITKTAGRLAFVSLNAWSPSGGLAAADARCTADAQSVGLSGTFRALLNTTTASAASRFSTTGTPWVRVDGIPIVAKAADLFNASGTLLAALNVTASGVYLTNYGGWSGGGNLNSPGTATTTCNDWTSSSVSAQCTAGRVFFGILSKAFAFDVGLTCDNQFTYLYCLQQ